MSKKYDSYKDSGIEWIGEIPSHWNTKRLKFIGNLYSGLSGKSGADFSSEASSNTKPFINFTNVANNKYIVSDNFGHVIMTDNENQNQVQKGDLLFLMSSENQEEVGKSALLNNDFGELYLNSFCKGLRISNLDIYPNFLNYLLNSSTLSQLVSIEGRGFTRINLRMEGVQNLPVFFPDKDEQITIANYLDQKTTQIEDLIAKKERLIQLLEEERTAIINQAVTKGLDPTVPIKDSGIEWLGEIPAHWEVKKLKYVANLISQKTSEKPEYIIALENIESWTGKIIGNPCENEMQGDAQLFEKGDVLFNKLRPYLAKVTLADKMGGAMGELLILRPNEFVTSEFLFQRLRSEMIITVVDGSTYGTKMPRASWDKFISLLEFGVPTIEEQNEIVKFICNNDMTIDSITHKYQQEIELLKEYKTALISEVVTGKVDVRDEK